MIKKAFLTIAFLILGLYIYLNITTYYPEKFKITSVKMTIFKMSGIDKLTGCRKLIKTQELNDTNDTYLLGLRYHLEYVSEKHEHVFFNLPKGPPGAFGHTDTIVSIDLSTDADLSIKELLEYAFEYKTFSTDDTLSFPHHLVNAPLKGTCFEALAYKNFHDFILEYNTDKIEDMLFNKMEDYHFYLIPKKMFKTINNRSIILKIQLNENTLIDSIKVGNQIAF